jgi:hypothetical protein
MLGLEDWEYISIVGGLIYQALSVQFTHGFDESNREVSTIG